MDPHSPSTGVSWRTFRFLRRIGKGGFGEVYLAEMSTGGGFAKPVAIKVLREDYLEDEEVLKRLRDEARMLGQLSHPNIVQADDLVTLAGRLSVVMEYVPGANLNWVINPKVYPDPIPPTVCCQIVSRVAEALEAAWSRPSTLTGEPLRVLHRDIKPSNIRLTPDGIVKVLDFGVARADLQDREADTQDLRMGSIPYMSPEVLLDLPHSSASDIYALGVTFYELTARRRFGKCKLQRGLHEALIDERFIQANLGDFLLAAEELEDLLRQMLAFDPNSRPGVQEVIARCRDMERRTVGPRVNEWAPSVVPGVVAGVNVELTEGELIGQTLSEDSSTASSAQRIGAGIATNVLLDVDPPTEETEPPLASSVMSGVSPAASAPPVYEPLPPAEKPGQGRLVVVLLLLIGAGVGAAVWSGSRDAQPLQDVDEPTTSVTLDEPVVEEPVVPPQLVEPEPVQTRPDRTRSSSTKTSAPVQRTRVEPEPVVTEPSPPEPEPVVTEPESASARTGTPEPDPSPETRPVVAAPVKSAATQEIAFSSKPLGVAVSIDGVYRGTTPLRATLSEGTHKVAYEAADGTRYKTVTVVAGERQVVIYDAAKDVIR